MLKVEVPKDKTKIMQQIKALEQIIPFDSYIDKQIHQEALKTLRKALERVYSDKG